jgi:hypothetical protein
MGPERRWETMDLADIGLESRNPALTIAEIGRSSRLGLIDALQLTYSDVP